MQLAHHLCDLARLPESHGGTIVPAGHVARRLADCDLQPGDKIDIFSEPPPIWRRNHPAPDTPPSQQETTPEPIAECSPSKSKIRRDRAKRKLDGLTSDLARSNKAKLPSLEEPDRASSARSSPSSLEDHLPRVPKHEWVKLCAMKHQGRTKCKFYNSSIGCRFGESCKQVHDCMACGQDHSWCKAHE